MLSEAHLLMGFIFIAVDFIRRKVKK